MQGAKTVGTQPSSTTGVPRDVHNPYDRDGALLLEGDRVIAASGDLPGEAGIVVRASGGPLISVRVDSSGQVWCSAASLWKKGRDV
jgi:hypothetical protein